MVLSIGLLARIKVYLNVDSVSVWVAGIEGDRTELPRGKKNRPGRLQVIRMVCQIMEMPR